MQQNSFKNNKRAKEIANSLHKCTLAATFLQRSIDKCFGNFTLYTQINRFEFHFNFITISGLLQL